MTMSTLENALPLYIKMINSMNRKMSVEELSLMRSSMLISTHIDLKTDILNFEKIIEKKNMSNTITGVFFCDMDHGEENIFIDLIKKYNGVYELQMNAPNPITCESDKEDNCFYAVFENPIICYTFSLELMALSRNE